MTRLIDADNLHTLLVKAHSFGELTAKKAIRAIEQAPTVDAIPVELIKESLKRLRRRRMNLDDDCVDIAWDLRMQIEALEDLLSEWAERKEE